MGRGPLDGFDAIVRRIAERSLAFGRPVLLLEGDSHDFLVDNPLDGVAEPHGVEFAVRSGSP